MTTQSYLARYEQDHERAEVRDLARQSTARKLRDARRAVSADREARRAAARAS